MDFSTIQQAFTMEILLVCALIAFFIPQLTASDVVTVVNDCPGLQTACQIQGNDSFICETTEICMIALITEIPKSCENLTIRTDIMAKSGVSFSYFSNLRHLELLWSKGLEDLLQAHQHNLSDTGMLRGLTNLVYLKISLPVIDINPTSLKDLKRLRHLDFTNFGFYSTAKFAGLMNGSLLGEKPLTHLTLQRISGVVPAKDRVFLMKDFVPTLGRVPLEYIDISYNNEVYLYPTYIQHIPFLRELHMRDVTARYMDDISDAQCTFIEGLLHQNITRIDLTGLGAVGSASDVFGLSFIKTALSCVTLNANKPNNTCVCEAYITTCGKYFHSADFCLRLPEFNYLDLNRSRPLALDNSRYCITKMAFPIPKQWTSIKFGHTQLIFTKHDWDNVTLCVAPNSIKMIDVSYITFKHTVDSFLMIGWEKLEVFDMAYSSWGYYFHDPRFLHVFPNLKVLNVTNTCIGNYLRNDTNNQTFAKSNGLKILHLQNAGLTRFSFNAFSLLINLEILDLSRNDLYAITFNVSGLLSLKLLNISHNILKQLDPIFTASLSSLSDSIPGIIQVDFLQNPLICDCMSLDFLNWITVTNILFLGKNLFLCTYKGRQQITMVTVDTWDLQVYCNLTLILSSTLVGAFILTIIVSATVYINRWRLRTLFLKALHSNKSKVPGDYIYDGFVVYADENRGWIHNDMLDELEKKRGLKLCIHHRDFTPGENIQDQIGDCIEKSRHTIIILTKQFMKSEWCMFEMRVARNLLPSVGRDVVVPILLAELPQESMKPEVRTLIREKTYLQWETSIEGQIFFWNKLTVALCGATSIDRERDQHQLLNVEGDSSGNDGYDVNILQA